MSESLGSEVATLPLRYNLRFHLAGLSSTICVPIQLTFRGEDNDIFAYDIVVRSSTTQTSFRPNRLYFIWFYVPFLVTNEDEQPLPPDLLGHPPTSKDHRLRIRSARETPYRPWWASRPKPPSWKALRGPKNTQKIRHDSSHSKTEEKDGSDGRPIRRNTRNATPADEATERFPRRRDALTNQTGTRRCDHGRTIIVQAYWEIDYPLPGNRQVGAEPALLAPRDNEETGETFQRARNVLRQEPGYTSVDLYHSLSTPTGTWTFDTVSETPAEVATTRV